MGVVTGLDLYKKYGHPDNVVKTLVVWDVPPELEIGNLPDKVYCHPDLIKPLTQAFKNLVDRGFNKEVKTWDGCWNYRPIRGYEAKYIDAMKQGKIELAIKYLSIHSWAMAVDLNAAENGLGKPSKLSAGFVQCFKDAGFNWGGDFKRLDAMHFEIASM